MSRFDGHIRELGDLAPEAVASITNMLSPSEHMWAADATRFSTDFPQAEHIVLRFPDNYPLSHTPASYRPGWGEWESLLTPIIEQAAAAMRIGRFDTAKIMFTRLHPGGRIARHVDENPSSAVPHKIHVPVITHPKAILHVEDTPYHLEVGHVYELNNLLPHSVENGSEVGRVHLIFDCFSVN